MFTKKHVILPIICVLISSCTNENLVYLTEPNVEVKGAGCLATSLSKFDLYFKGGMQDQEVAAFWDCMETTLKSVDRYLKGDGEGGSFKKLALKNFVSKHFLKSEEPGGIVLTDKMLDEVMEIKRLFLGGSRELLAPQEIRKVYRVFRDLKVLTVRLNPQMKLLFSNNKKAAPDATELSNAVTVLSETLLGIGQLLSNEQNGYKIERFENFVRELHKIIGDPNDPSEIEWLKFVPAFQEMKNIFLLTDKNSIEPKEWIILSRLIGQGFSLYYRSKYFLNSKSLLSLNSSSEIPKILDNVYFILKEALERRSDKAFSTSEFRNIIDALELNGLLPDFMDKQDLIKIWEIVVDRILVVPGQRDRNPNGLGDAELSYGRKLWQDWDYSQRFLLGAATDANRPDIINLLSFMDLPWAFKLDNLKRLIFAEPLQGGSDIELITEVNMLRTAFNALVKAYNPEDLALDIDELKTATEDLKPLLIQLGLVSKTDVNFHNTLFLYSNLFMPFSNGDDRIDPLELTYFVVYVFKAETASNLFFEDLNIACVQSPEKLYRQECFRNKFRAGFNKAFENLPNLIGYTEGLKKDKDWLNFTKDFELAVRKKETPKDFISKSEIAQIFMLTQFIETIMMRYDQDNNKTLDINEGLSAVPLFQLEISKISGIDDPEELKVLFTYLLRYGEAPDLKNPISLIRYLFWRLNKNKWKLETDRGNIVKILSSFN